MPLAVWPCAQRTSQYQRLGRYLPESNRHPGKMLPALARRAIETYSEPGDVVVDPMCGIGTTLVEAAHANRAAIGVELEGRWAELARRNLSLATANGATGDADVITGDARELSRLLLHRRDLLGDETADGKVARLPGGAVDLILLSPPYACAIGEVSKSRAGVLCIEETRNYAPDRNNIGHARGSRYSDAMLEIYGAAATVLKPGGFLVAVTKGMRQEGALRDLASQTVELCQEVGLLYWQHVIALLATIRDDQLIPRASFWQMLQTRRALERGEHTHLVCHEDVLVFRKPDERR